MFFLVLVPGPPNEYIRLLQELLYRFHSSRGLGDLPKVISQRPPFLHFCQISPTSAFYQTAHVSTTHLQEKSMHTIKRHTIIFIFEIWVKSWINFGTENRSWMGLPGLRSGPRFVCRKPYSGRISWDPPGPHGRPRRGPNRQKIWKNIRAKFGKI